MRLISAPLQRVKQRLARLERRSTHFAGAPEGVAAVEFALILPFFLVIYFGSIEITQALLASRKATISARTIADLVAQEQTTFTDTQLSEVLSAATAIMSPFPSNTLAVTITGVDFTLNTNTNAYDAKPAWTVTANGGTARPCAVLSPVSNTAATSPSTLPTGIYAPGQVIVADITYVYQPTFGTSFFGSSFGLDKVITYRHSAYMRPRDGKTIGYQGSTGTTCP